MTKSDPKMKSPRRVIGTLMAILVLLGVLLPSNPAQAINACNTREQYDSSYCNFMADEISPAAEDLYSCQDSWGYKGTDHLWYVGFKTQGNGLLVRGQDLPFTAQLSQDCRAWNNAYKISVTLVSETGDSYSSENQQSEFLYKNKLQQPLLTYCSTSTCGSAVIRGTINVPVNAPDGKYKIKVRVSPWGSTTTAENKNYLMRGFLSTYPQARTLPNLAKVTTIEAAEGQISCYITDFVDTAVAAFDITGSNWSLYEDGKLIDSYQSFPIAKSDNPNILRLTHGYLMSNYLESIRTRAYTYSFANQKIGSKYECRVSISTKYGSGLEAKSSAVSKVQTLGIDVIAKAPAEVTAKISTIYCKKGKTIKAIKSSSPKCPIGFVKVKSAKG